MTNEHVVPTEPVSQSEHPLHQMPRSEFIKAWKELVGEPPAMMLESRSEMIRLLVESTLVVPLVGANALTSINEDEWG